MTGFSRIELQLKPALWLPRLWGLLLVLALLALWLIPADLAARVLSMLALLIWMPLLCWPLLHPHAEDDPIRLVWEPDRGDMQLLTRSGHWCQVERIRFSCSVPGLIQAIKLQRRDRAFPTWLLLTPERISRTEVRRLHVALRWAPPLGSHPATEN